MAQLDADVVAKYKKAFSSYDTDGNGSIDAKEMTKVLKDLGENPTEEEIKELFMPIIDRDGNGTIEFAEFLDLMKMYEVHKKKRSGGRRRRSTSSRGKGKGKDKE